MKKYVQYGSLITTLFLVLFYCFDDGDILYSTNHSSEVSSKLAVSINNCQGIAAKSVAHLNAFLEFQKLEIEGRKMHVFQRCMNDQGYVENPAWVQYAEPITQRQAKASGISSNEAHEKFRRTQMVLIKQSAKQPSYWVLASQGKQ